MFWHYAYVNILTKFDEGFIDFLSKTLDKNSNERAITEQSDWLLQLLISNLTKFGIDWIEAFQVREHRQCYLVEYQLRKSEN